MSMLKSSRPSDASTASLLPFGDQAGLLSCAGLVASFLKPLPSGSTMKISNSPAWLSNLAKAISPLWLVEAGLVGPVPAFCASQLASITTKAKEATSRMILPVANRFTLEKMRLFICFSLSVKDPRVKRGYTVCTLRSIRSLRWSAFAKHSRRMRGGSLRAQAEEAQDAQPYLGARLSFFADRPHD